MMTTMIMKLTDKIVMSESGMMDKMKSGVWRVARGLVSIVVVALLVASIVPTAEADTTVATYPGTGSNVTNPSGSGISWANPNRIVADDSSSATITIPQRNSGGCTLTANNSNTGACITDYLQASNFGFSIPTGATIDGITVEFQGWTTGSSPRPNDLNLMKAGTIVGNNDADSSTRFPSGEGAVFTGGSATDLWGTTWTAADVNDPGFGVSLTAFNNNASNDRPVDLDFIRVTIDYTPGGGGGSCDFNIDPLGTYIAAENFSGPMGAPNPWTMEVRTNTVTDGNNNSNSGDYLYTTSGGTGANPSGSRVDYPITITAAGTYEIWIHALDQPGGGGGDSVFWGVNGQYVGAITQSVDNVWAWSNGLQNGTNQYTFAAGDYQINIWPRETGQHFDSFVLFQTGSSPFSGNNQTNTPAGLKSIDPSCVDSGVGGSGTITIPDGQLVNGASLTLTSVDLATYDPGTIGANEIIYDPTNQTGLQYRAMSGEADGFHGFSVDPKWTLAHVGNSTPTQGMAVSGGELSLSGRGADIWNNNDFFTYLYQAGVSGDFIAEVEVTSMCNTNNWAKAGIMARQSLALNSKHAMSLISWNRGAAFQARTSNGNNTNRSSSGRNSAPDDAVEVGDPVWLRLVRNGLDFRGWWSVDDGQSWTQQGNTRTLDSLVDPVFLGLAVTSRNTGTDCTATFDNFQVTPLSTSGMPVTGDAASWVDVTTSIDTDGPGTAWTDGSYGLSIRSNTQVYDTNTFTYSSCIDGTPSALTVAGGQTVQGSSVNLSSLFTVDSGNVASFTYEIDGVAVSNPWNSYAAQVPGTTGPHTFRVSGMDPDCGRQVAATGTITVNNFCPDPDVSTLTILNGQAVGGTAVDLTALVSATGNVGGSIGGSYDKDNLTYKINGGSVDEPTSWNSSVYGGVSSEDVTLEITGTDPDCGATITALNTISVNNICTPNEPSIVFDRDTGFVGAGRAVPYQVTIRNEDSYDCSPSTFNVNITLDPVNVDFVASYFNPVGSNLSITLNGRESATLELAVEATSGATKWNEKDVTLTIFSQTNPEVHNAGPTTGTVTTKVFLVSPITHNSVTTGSTKWGGNWGTSEDGSKYGNFDCMTCHEKGKKNIKWLREDITLPDSTQWGGNASTPVTRPIQMKDARSGKEILADADPDNTVYWGHDDPAEDGSGRTSSERICEVCHSITKQHRFNTQQDPIDPPEGPVGPLTIEVGKSHFPDRDCTDCHRHDLGFTASCTGCHGYPPLEATSGGPNGLAAIPGSTGSVTPGAHYKHTQVLNFPCEYCHSGWRDLGQMPKTVSGQQEINHQFNVFYDLFADPEIIDPVTKDGQYTGQDGVRYSTGVVPPGEGTMTCENIYCHGGTDSMGGNNPRWNGNVTCGDCHGASSDNTPPGYSHTTHVKERGLLCTQCHGDGQVDDQFTPGTNGHVNGQIQWDVRGLPSKGGTPTYRGAGTGNTNSAGDDMPPSTTYGTCNNIACHYGTETPPWNNNSQAADCTTCHYNSNGTQDGSLENAAPAVGNHNEHVRPQTGTIHETMISTFVNKCQSCHGGGANTGDHAGHVNLQTDLGGGLTYDSGNKTCTSQCHALISDENSQITWGTDMGLSCAACHSTPYLGPTVVDPDGNGAGMAASGFGSHLKVTKIDDPTASTNWFSQCRSCHPFHVLEGTNKEVEIPLPPESWDNPGTVAVETDNMREKLGLNYPVTGALHLGGTATNDAAWYYDPANPAMAEMCWGCHGLDSELNEWGFNADTNTGSWPQTGLAPDTTTPAGHTYWDDGGVLKSSGGSYNYGYLYTADHVTGTYNGSNATTKWVTATGLGNFKRDGYQHDSASSPAYALSKQIKSVHSVNFDSGKLVSSVSTAVDADGIATAVAQEPPEDIMCVYCHDVHDLNRAVDPDTLVAETATGRPYLRGSWFGNPYPADVPPLSSYEGSYNAAGDNEYFMNGEDFGGINVPRLLATSNASKLKGGFFIDANSGNPTASFLNSGDRKAELTDTAGLCTTCHGTDVDNMNFYDNSVADTNLWRNVGKNGHANSTLGGSGNAHANASDIFDARRGGGKSNMGNQSAVGRGEDWGKDSNPSGAFSNRMDELMKSGPSQMPYIGWYGNTSTHYNQWYSGSTIGVDNNSSSGRAHSYSCSKCHSPHASHLPALLITNCLDVTLSTYSNGGADPTDTQAINCHRNQSTTTGWNRLAPGQ